MDQDALVRSVAEDRERMIASMCAMLRFPAVGPESGGKGESEKAAYLLGLLKELGLTDIEVLESADPRVPSGKRPNIIAKVKGSTRRRTWVVAHMDVVPEGDPSAWKYPPFEGTVTDGRIYGRGSEDNGQELLASLFGLHALIKNGIEPETDVGLVFVADEEQGNTHGIDFLLAKDIFRKGDIVVVPDHGVPGGGAIEVVEKGIAWVEVDVHGRQTHASTPNKGVNAFEVSARFLAAVVDKLRAKYTAKDPLFDPPYSTFTPTRCASNGPNINTVPGSQSFAFDFRVLPDYPLDDIISDMKAVASEFERSTGAEIRMSFAQRADAAPKTGVGSEVVKRLSAAIRAVKGIEPRPLGIGGGTCAAPFRRNGIEAAVWATTMELAHDANEYCEISSLVSDAQVYALLFAGANAPKG